MKRKNFTPKKDRHLQQAQKLQDLSSTEGDELDVEALEKQSLKKKKINPPITAENSPVQGKTKQQQPIWKERQFTLRDISHKLSSLPILFNYATAPKNNLLFENPKNQVLNIGFCVAFEDGEYQFKNYDGEYEVIEDEDIIGDLRKLVQYSNYVAKK